MPLNATENRLDELGNTMVERGGGKKRMNDTVLKIALAGLLHDVGKFAWMHQKKRAIENRRMP